MNDVKIKQINDLVSGHTSRGLANKPGYTSVETVARRDARFESMNSSLRRGGAYTDKFMDAPDN